MGNLNWCRFLQVWHAGSQLEKMHSSDYVERMFCRREFALSNSVVVLFVPVEVRREIMGSLFWQ